MNIAIRESKQRSLVGWLGLVGAVVFFGLFFLYVWLRIKPELIHHNDNPVFLTGVDFLKGFLARPGGPVEYVSLFFWQFYYCRWAGTLIITLTAAVICLATRGMMLAMGERRPGPHPGGLAAAPLRPLQPRPHRKRPGDTGTWGSMALRTDIAATGRLAHGRVLGHLGGGVLPGRRRVCPVCGPVRGS